MTTSTNKSQIEQLLEDIFIDMLKGVHADLKDKDRRTASVLNAARAIMADNGINIDGLKALRDALQGAGSPAGDKLAGILADLPRFDDEADVPTLQ